jgi:GT2 family glycosyltransferase
MKNPSSTAIAVINYNTRDLLRQCLASLEDAESAPIVVVDNASADGSVEMVRAEFPHVEIVANTVNGGYGKAVNDSMRASDRPYTLILNADTRFLSGSLPEAARYLDERPSIAIVGPALVNPDGSYQRTSFPFPGTLAWFCENDPLGMVLRHVPPLRRRMRRYLPRDQTMTASWVMGAALLVRRSAFDEVGGADESYFMYYEEVDLCYRLRDAGWKIQYAPILTFEHLGGASTSQQPSRMITQHFHSTERFYRRHYSGLRLWVWLNLMRIKLASCLILAATLVILPGSLERRKNRRVQLKGWMDALLSKYDSHGEFM